MNEEVKTELQNLDWELRQQQQAIERDATERGLDPYRAMYTDGTYVLVPVLTARATVLSALAGM